MTEEKLRRMMKYAELIRVAAYMSADFDELWGYRNRYSNLANYLIHRMEREMKR